MPQAPQAAVMQLLAVVCLESSEAQGEACAVALLLLLAWLLV